MSLFETLVEGLIDAAAPHVVDLVVEAGTNAVLAGRERQAWADFGLQECDEFEPGDVLEADVISVERVAA